MKIPTLFIRDYTDAKPHLTDIIANNCHWVSLGEGYATRKYDGTCVMYDGDWWARRECRGVPPEGFREEFYDTTTAKRFGWVSITESPFYAFWKEAVEDGPEPYGWDDWPNGTFELIGPKINGNPEGYERHALVSHAAAERLHDVPTDYDGLKAWLATYPHEGVVWHHTDGRMAKIKRKDFK